MKCPSCSNDIPSSAKFCPKCGVSISQRPVEELSDVNVEEEVLNIRAI